MEAVSNEDLKGLTWPTPAVDLDGDGVPLPLDTLLQALQLLGTDSDRAKATGAVKWDGDTPASMQVIKSGALGISKKAIAWVGSVGGVTGAVTAIAGVLTTFVGDVGEPVTVALMGSAAVILSSVAIALALFVRGDLQARGIATAARYQGRADVAAAFLSSTGAMRTKATPEAAPDGARTLVEDFLDAMRSYPDRVRVTTTSKPTPVVVSRVWRHSTDTGLRLLIGTLGSQDEIGLDEITGFTTAAS